MSELPEGVPPAPLVEPRRSASGIVLRRAGQGRFELLFGLRSRRSRFMPGHLSFPGGVLDAVDRPEDPGAFVRCVCRELEEEAGLSIPGEAWVEAGERITPPLFPLRFRTRFFVTLLDEAQRTRPVEPTSPENETMRFAVAAEVLDEWVESRVRVPPPLLPILRALGQIELVGPAEIARCVAAVNAEEEDAPRIEFTPDVWMLPVKTDTMPPATHTNVWMPGGRRFVIIDPGSGDEDEQTRLLRVVERRVRLGQRPWAVVLTHQHRDHVAGAAALAGALDLPILAHAHTLEALAVALAGIEQRGLADGALLDLEGMWLRAVFTPGHAAGHLAFLVEPGRWLIGGDLVSGLSTILIDPDQGEMRAYLESLERAERLGCRLVLPGHGPPLPTKALRQMIEHRHERERRILAELDATPRAIEQIARRVYTESPEPPLALAASQTRAHLLDLERRGQASRQDTAGRRWHLPGQIARGSAERIEMLLTERFAPVRFELRDESRAHVGHAGASSGGGHYHVTIVSAVFAGQSLVEQHRMVYEALGEMIGREIHALSLTTRCP